MYDAEDIAANWLVDDIQPKRRQDKRVKKCKILLQFFWKKNPAVALK